MVGFLVDPVQHGLLLLILHKHFPELTHPLHHPLIVPLNKQNFRLQTDDVLMEITRGTLSIVYYSNCFYHFLQKEVNHSHAFREFFLWSGVDSFQVGA